MSFEPSDKYTDSALRIADVDTYPQRLVGEFIGTVVSNTQRNDVRRISIMCRIKPEELPIGGSIACNGICMTVVARDGRLTVPQASAA